MKNNKNMLRAGLKTEKKLKKSFYDFLYNKHFDWAIILASFFACLPYIASSNMYFLIIRSFFFLWILFLSIRYITFWREIVETESSIKKVINIENKLIEKSNLKKKELEEISSFLNDFRTEIAKIKKMISEFFNEEGGGNTSVEYFIVKNPEKFNDLLNILNKNLEVTKSSLGIGMVIMRSIQELRHVPKLKYQNYKRICIMLILVIIFFITYGVETIITK